MDPWRRTRAMATFMTSFQIGGAPEWIRWTSVSMDNLVRVMPVANMVSATRIIFRPRTAWVKGISHY